MNMYRPLRGRELKHWLDAAGGGKVLYRPLRGRELKQ